MSDFQYEPTLQFGPDTTDYRHITADHVRTLECDGRTLLHVDADGLRLLAREAFEDVSFYLRPDHLQSLRDMLDDPDVSDNDKFVCYTHLQNAVVSAEGKLPSCQDTGTAIVLGKKGRHVLTDGDDAAALSHGIYETWQDRNLRYSQIAPLQTFSEQNTRTNLPAQIDLAAETAEGSELAYKFLFVAKGGGSANKTYLYQSTPAVLDQTSMLNFLEQHLKDLGTAACPPYHIAVVIGGTSAETNLKMVKLASAKYLDNLPTSGSEGGRAFRDVALEKKVLELARGTGLGAQFGGTAFAHDVRVIRMSRHAASMPIGLGVSCSADRNIVGKITPDGIFLEKLERDPVKYLPADPPEMAPPVEIDLDMGLDKVRQVLSKFPIRTRLNISGTLIVARDQAHKRIREMIDAGQSMPDYFKQHPIYYAGPAKTPQGMPSGSFGPTTAGRMDSYVEPFQALGGSLVMIAKGNRSKQVTEACAKHGGFYLGSIGGPAAILAQNNIRKVDLVDFEELGMEAVRRIEVENFPAFIIVDDKGNDFFAEF